MVSEIQYALELARSARRNENLGPDLQKSAVFRFVTRFVSPKTLRHCIYPHLVRSRGEAYDAKTFFDSYFRSVSEGELSDGMTVSPRYQPLTVNYHYNVMEKALIEVLVRFELAEQGSVLDIGAGAGHWIDFYLRCLSPGRVVGLDIADPSVQSLRARYAGEKRVEIHQGDISGEGFDLGERFQIINAVGVIFHIVDDEAWKRAVKNMAAHLEQDGLLIVGGQFGWMTRNVQFHSTDTFARGDDAAKAKSDLARVNKRIRSLRYWKRVAGEAGLRVRAVRRTAEVGYIYTPENNILALSRE